MNKYTNELQKFRIDDEMQGFELDQKGYYFITTASHGYLVVPVEDKNIELARSIAKYGYIGNEAVYLEEDCEASEFINSI